MPITLTIDQRKSRSDDDLVERWVTELNHEFAGRLLLPFVPTVGDELQALTDDASVGDLHTPVSHSDDDDGGLLGL